ncbi:YlzJ-like family protein [Paenibacillus sp. FSL K6-1096]|uniref:YlzJ-like family protein n=1 Tax=Paenibacillus sp. FSL K6-1096 TaxID=2921460 RepID=UPI0030ED266E
MSLYTVLAMEQIFDGALSYTRPLQEISVQGMLLQVEPLDGGQAKIVRLLHGPLDKYLDAAYAPGAVIQIS